MTIVVPSHAIEYDYHLSDKADVSHCDASLKWSQRDGPKHGLEYVYDVQKLNNGDWSHTLVVRQIGRQVQTFSSRYQMGSETKSVSVDINHSHDLTRRINLEVCTKSLSLMPYYQVMHLRIFFFMQKKKPKQIYLDFF